MHHHYFGEPCCELFILSLALPLCQSRLLEHHSWTERVASHHGPGVSESFCVLRHRRANPALKWHKSQLTPDVLFFHHFHPQEACSWVILLLYPQDCSGQVWACKWSRYGRWQSRIKIISHISTIWALEWLISFPQDCSCEPSLIFFGWLRTFPILRRVPRLQASCSLRDSWDEPEVSSFLRGWMRLVQGSRGFFGASAIYHNESQCARESICINSKGERKLLGIKGRTTSACHCVWNGQLRADSAKVLAVEIAQILALDLVFQLLDLWWSV